MGRRADRTGSEPRRPRSRARVKARIRDRLSALHARLDQHHGPLGALHDHLHDRFRDHLRDRINDRIQSQIHDHLHDRLRGHIDEHRAWRHAARGFRHRWRMFSGAHLRRRLFLWFGASIFVTALAVASFEHMMRSGQARPHVPGLVFLLVPAFILWAAAGKVARRIARPLDELVQVAQDIGAGKLGARARLDCGGIDEIAELSRAVNDMAARIERQLADQRELLAGVSHEIRTPLGRLRLLVEIGRERAQGADLDEIEREVLEIDALVGQLLASARLDFSALTLMPLDAGEVAQRAAERAGLGAERVVVELADRAFVGDPTLLARALANLLENARLHGGGVDWLRVRGAAPLVEFAVQDRGPGFPPGQEQRVFERFYRPHTTAAPPGDKAGGAHATGLGLGLALVRRIAEAHGGRVTARNRHGGVDATANAGAAGVEPRGGAGAEDGARDRATDGPQDGVAGAVFGAEVALALPRSPTPSR